MSDYRRITIARAGEHTGESVEIAGWLYNLRKSGKIIFPLIRDGSGSYSQALPVSAGCYALALVTLLLVRPVPSRPRGKSEAR